MKTQHGFTLIEILIVVVIIGILSAVAIPIYSGYIASGKIVEAHSTLTSARIQMEQSYQDNRTYVGAACPGATTYFTYTCALTANTFTLTATNQAGNGLGAAGRYVYTINQNNTKATTAFPVGRSSANTWITK